MARREEENVYDDDSGSREKRDEAPRKRQFSGVTKIYDNKNKRTIVVEFSPDDGVEMGRLCDLVSEERDYPTLDRCISMCREAGIRARVLLGQQYVGHIYDDGSTDKEVSRLLA